ncbi:P-loop containing nucleoside triphosphate hydrolase protein [Xylogone sp. PMI_703]|nr:P-loop containing nucleoside triphosphate hydrolase protein [Xylogone sp. PMI_703]
MADRRSNARSGRLRNLFTGILSGKQSITTTNASLFLEAICDQTDPTTCVQRLISSAGGLHALKLALWSNTSLPFINNHFANLLKYLQPPELKSICGGAVLRQVICEIVEPPLAWNALVAAVKSREANDSALDGFSWLLLQLVTSLPVKQVLVYCEIIRDPAVYVQLIASPLEHVRTRTHRIIHIAQTVTTTHEPSIDGPGGRHDNDFAEIQKIAILPTRDELEAKNPFLRRATDVHEDESRSTNLALHIDNQFRLLREDMLRELREEIQSATKSKKGRGRGLCIENLRIHNVLCDERDPWSFQFLCKDDLSQLKGKETSSRKRFIKENTRFLKHQSIACVMVEQSLITLATLVRNYDLLVQTPPIICLQIPGEAAQKVIPVLLTNTIKIIQLNTAVFSYEPVLKQLQEIKELSLESDILHWKRGSDIPAPSYSLSKEITQTLISIEKDHTKDLCGVLDLKKPTKLDKAQATCFIAGLRQRVSLIQGPPGTGKSFIGSLITKAIHKHSSEKILVVCYTHHALDQFLEDLLNLGIPETDMVRLGSATRATARTEALSLKEMRQSIRINHDQWKMLNSQKDRAREDAQNLHKMFPELIAKWQNSDIMEHLEFKADGPPFFEAFWVPQEEDGWDRVDNRGKAVDEFYLLNQWCRGLDAGIYKGMVEETFEEIWEMNSQEREQLMNGWFSEMLQERTSRFHEAGVSYDASLDKIQAVYMEKDLQVMRGKRIIGCTTTAAAKYVKTIQSISPGVLLVEEAGEILESHVLTALGPETKQLVLIGDHKQLRPRVHYDLSVEKGDGYDLNRSLFERLVLKDYPHHVLYQQHRMRPELSALVRQITYPELVDAPSTRGRPDLRGFLDNLIFVNHSQAEIELQGVPDWKDGGSTSSKKNLFEAKMTLKCVRYLGQQGYRTDNIVILTPYLGQLRLLLDELKQDNDPVLNDLDSYDLVRAGLMPAASANVKKPRIRISTIDNYQGEESDIAIISLTRSNPRNDIGFMTAPERLNVLLSRARNALIMIGDAETFMNSRKGKDLWKRFIGILKEGRHIYDGFPVKCERHPNRHALLSRPEAFDKECPDGGCLEPCGATLKCGIHKCPQYCHQLSDHSKMNCTHVMETKCDRGHLKRWKCHESQPTACQACVREDQKRQRELQAELERQAKLDQEQAEHLAKMADLDRQIKLARELVANAVAAEQNAQALEQKRLDLEAAKLAATRALNKPPQTPAKVPPAKHSSSKSSSPDPIRSNAAADEKQHRADQNIPQDVKGESEKEWERQKRIEGASNDALDALMGLTGLEEVKSKILTIKSKIETVQRQGTDMKKERLGLVLLGNPGTGKTTVARIYAQFLSSVGVLPGTEFIETTGARLANEGVAGAKKHIDKILSAGGGTLFLDEAYQLASGNNPGGSSVLDFLLAEIENQVGKIVFILAGYNTQMEKFFEHNPGFDSRMPYRLCFADYSDSELLIMLHRLIEKKYNGRAKVEDGYGGLYARVAIRRLGRGRGREGYGNARALENVWARVTDRQASRIQRERAAGRRPDDLLFIKEDLIGPEPSGAIRESTAWKELQALIGLQAVKDSIKGLVNNLQLNYIRELDEKPPVEVSLNRIFLGSPGTGKTTVGKLYGQLLADMGMLSKREVVIKNPSDFMGSVIGESEKNTRAILKSTEGKVLIIDEAYMLYSGTQGVGNTSDPYKTAIIDTIVAEVQSTPGEDRCVLLLGYREQMEEMLKNSNPGLARRFQLNYAFHFEDFDDTQLREILKLKLKKQGLDATEEAKDVAIEILSRARHRPNFGNAGEVENLISHAKAQEQKRRSSGNVINTDPDICFLPQDFDKNFDRASRASQNLQELFADMVGSAELIDKFEKYQRIAATMKERGMDARSQIPFNFIFKGPPGTGKTTTARKIGQVFYDMGLLSTSETLERSASDLIAGYVGQTGPKTISVLKDGLGKVLFIDEAYRLGEGHFAKEAIDELVDSLTKPQFRGKLVVILAGYTEDINTLLKVNPGLSSRFPDEVVFRNMTDEECLSLLRLELKGAGIEFFQEDHQSEDYRNIMALFGRLSCLPSWGNGRDIKTLSRTLIGHTFGSVKSKSEALAVSCSDVIAALQNTLEVQLARQHTKSNVESSLNAARPIFDLPTQNFSPQPTKTSLSSAVKDNITRANEEQQAVDQSFVCGENSKEVFQAEETSQEPERDPGVSDEIWAQLQAHIRANDLAQKHSEITIANLEHQVATSKAEEETSKQATTLSESIVQPPTAPAGDDEEAKERKRKHEEARLRALKAHLAAKEAEEKLRKAKELRDKERAKEAKIQKKLRDMGVCIAGFRWIKEASGYRCAGGSHYISNSQLR